MKLDDTTRMMLREYAKRMRAEPDESAYPKENGSAQNAYWRAYDNWDAEMYGWRLMLASRLIFHALEDITDG